MPSDHSISAPIGIIGAMRDELFTVLQHMQDIRDTTLAGRSFRQGVWHGQTVVTVLSRIGKVAAATTATALIERFGVQAIVFTGVAGGIGEGVRVGDVVLARSFVQHDMNASPLFAPLEVPLYGKIRFDTDAALSDALAQAAHSTLAQPQQMLADEAIAAFNLHAPRLHQGLIASGDRFVGTSAESHTLRQRLPDALAVEMEGAAVAQVCHDYGVPFAALRTISDRADEQASTDFSRFVEQVASHYSAAILDRWLRTGS